MVPYRLEGRREGVGGLPKKMGRVGPTGPKWPLMVFSLAWGWLSLMPLFLLVLALLALFFERKFIAIAQKRLGISFLGRNGWAHLPADLVKFWLKQSYKTQGTWLGAQAGLAGAILAYLS